MTVNTAISIPQATLPQPTPLVSDGDTAKSGGLSFGDILDAVNPLQHIPVISNLVRAVTGSHISSAAQIAGDTLYGALLPGGALAGLASSAADVAVKEVTGMNVGDTLMGAVSGTGATSSATAVTGTPLVATPASDATATAKTEPDAKAQLMALTPKSFYSLMHHSGAQSKQYDRAQMLDGLNQKLVKMSV